MLRLLALVLAVVPLLVFAKDAVPTDQDPVAAQRAVGLSEQLRCLVCQNQSIAESIGELAIDLRRQINEQIAAGRTDGEIIDFMVQRYGDFVLYRPPFKAATVLLWLGPALLLLAGLWALRRALRQRARAAEERPLSDDERARAARLLGGEPPQ
jgi:cytochrome c-type biogenesis protein CcmH